MRQVLAQLGVQYRCKAVDKSIPVGILSLSPIVNDVACMRALAPLRELFPKLTNGMSEMVRVTQVCKST